jgi:asparagine synthase (glutamine-hydrolysing)
MSGQAGCFYFDRRPVDDSLVVTLNQKLARYGPDGEGYHRSPGLLMVHRACHFDGFSEAEAQPYVTTGLAVTFDGRLDNRADLLMWLHGELNGNYSDAAIATAAYSRWGCDGLARLIGDWSLTIWDDASATLLLASDYAGVVPLYFSVDPGCIRWSSSLQDLVERTDSAEDIDESWIAAFLRARPKFNHTVFRKIKSVPPAHAVRAARGRLDISRFWKPPLHDSTRYRDERQYEEALLHYFREAVAVRLRSNRPVACDLSGGLDSSSVTCMATSLVRSRAVEASRVVSFTELDDSADDAHHARIVLERLGIQSVYCDMQPTWSVSLHQSRPAMGIARRNARARLLSEAGVRMNVTGIPGDFVMGNDMDDCGQLADSICDWKPLAFLAGAYSWSRALRVPIYHVILRGLVPFLSPKRQVTSWKQKALRESNLYYHLERPLNCLTPRLLSKCEEELCDQLQVNDWWAVRPSLRKFHWALDHHSLSRLLESPAELEPVRTTHPYMHRPLVEFVTRIPRNQLCAPGKRRDLMRRAFAELLPHEIALRSTKATMGYRHQIDAKQVLAHLPSAADDWDVVKRGWVERTTLRQMLHGVSTATLREWSDFSMVLTLETWLASRNKSFRSQCSLEEMIEKP